MTTPDEPASPPRGATDAGLDGVDVTHEYVGDDGILFGDVAAATWATVLAYARSFLGVRPPGYAGENVNTFTRRFYGDGTAAAWCLIFVWYVLNHFGKTSWKLAFVPWLNRIPGFRSGATGIKVGDICAIAGYSHVGFYVADHGAEFDLLSGNSLWGGSDDAISVKRYSKSVISGHVAMTYAPGPHVPPAEDDFVAMVA